MDIRHPRNRAERYPLDWVFCSKRCQDIFHTAYGQWQQVSNNPELMKDIPMTNITDMERQAMHSCLKAFGQAAERIGFDKPLGQYDKDEALQVIEAITLCWSQAMAAQHEANKYPPMRNLPASSDPLADLTDDIPF